MIDKEVFLRFIIQKAEKLPVGHYLDIRTYKRNRSVLLIKEGENFFRIIKNGFYQNEFKSSFKELKKIFKKTFKNGISS